MFMVLGYKIMRRGQEAPNENPAAKRQPAEQSEEAKASAPHRETKSKRRFIKRRIFVIPIIICLLLIGTGFAYWRFVRQPANANPFTPKVMASVQFSLYYPTRLPTGYRIDGKSVTEPQQGVVVFNMVGPRGQKLYMSEEARPTSFDLGGFYKKFAGLKEIGVSDGAIAVGHINSGRTEIASRANNKTWILSNTTASIPFNQLIDTMKSLTLSY
jgi:hypothetical protein